MSRLDVKWLIRIPLLVPQRGHLSVYAIIQLRFLRVYTHVLHVLFMLQRLFIKGLNISPNE